MRREVCIVLVLLMAGGSAWAAPLGTAFSYQGRLWDGGVLPTGSYDLQFRLYDAATGGTQQGATLTVEDVAVVGGLFTVSLDFGSAIFNGQARWLQVAVRPGTSVGAFTVLSPRQVVTPTPYALQTRGLYVDSSLNVGIGTTAPAGKLDIRNGSLLINSGTGRVELGYTPNGDRWVFNTSGGGQNLQFVEQPEGGSSFTRVVFRSGGNVGIGTTSPEEQLSVAGVLKVDQSNANSGGMDIKFGLGNTGEGIGSKRTPGGNQNGLDLFTNHVSRLSISAAGNVGIGTTAPTHKLDVVGAGRFQVGVGSIAMGTFVGSTSAIVATGVNGHRRDIIFAADCMRLVVSPNSDPAPLENGITIRNNGDVGIGTDHTAWPASRVQIKGGDLTFEDQTDSARQIRNAYDLVFCKDIDNDNLDSWFRFFTDAGIEQMRIYDGDEASILGDGPFVSNGLDFAEAFRAVEADLAPGDVVSLAIGSPEYCQRSSAAYDPALLGVVSARPSFVAGASFEQEAAVAPVLAQQRDQARAMGDDAAEKQLTREMTDLVRRTHRPVALLGRVPCKVVGPVKAGDYLTSSAVPGHAMRQTQAGPTLGIALEDFAGPDTGMIVVFVRPGWYGGAGAAVEAPAAEGVELAEQLERKDAQVADLAARVAALEQLVSQLAGEASGGGQ